jgi:membrane protease YdiL (CAAX protease family)
MRIHEVWLILSLTMIPSAAFALISLTERPIRGSRVSLNPAVVRWPEGARQLVFVLVDIVPVLLVGHLLMRSGESWSDLGVDKREPQRDFLQGAALGFVLGGAGLGFYVAAFHLGLSRAVIPVNDNGVWWQIPILVLSALRFGVLEETILVGYLLRRLGQLHWRAWPAIMVSAILRGTYHLYQGYGALIANVIMGLLFGRWRMSGRRTMPLIVAHFLIDAVTFVGWVLLHDRLRWLPH